MLLFARTRARTRSPRSTSKRATWLPTNPGAPVTSINILAGRPRVGHFSCKLRAVSECDANLRQTFDSAAQSPSRVTPAARIVHATVQDGSELPDISAFPSADCGVERGRRVGTRSYTDDTSNKRRTEIPCP